MVYLPLWKIMEFVSWDDYFQYIMDCVGAAHDLQ